MRQGRTEPGSQCIRSEHHTFGWSTINPQSMISATCLKRAAKPPASIKISKRLSYYDWDFKAYRTGVCWCLGRLRF